MHLLKKLKIALKEYSGDSGKPVLFDNCTLAKMLPIKFHLSLVSSDLNLGIDTNCATVTLTTMCSLLGH